MNFAKLLGVATVAVPLGMLAVQVNRSAEVRELKRRERELIARQTVVHAEAATIIRQWKVGIEGAPETFPVLPLEHSRELGRVQNRLAELGAEVDLRRPSTDSGLGE